MQDMSLLEWMGRDGLSNEVEVFRKFTAKLMSLQKQVDPSYHSDQYLRDRLLSDVDIPEIRIALRDRIPRTSAQAINCIANRLSDKPKTAGANAVEGKGRMTEVQKWRRDRRDYRGISRENRAPYRQPIYANAAENFDTGGELVEWEVENDGALYSLKRTYGGVSRRQLKTSWKNTHPKRRNDDSGSRKGRRLDSRWLRNVRGCFVCGKLHRANEKDPRHEVTAAIRRLKANHPSALLTISDLETIQNMQDSQAQGSDKEAAEVQWAEDDDLEDEADAFYIQLEEKLAN